MARAFAIAPVLMVLAVVAGSAQGDVESVRSRLETRFEILPIASGVVLTPRFGTDVRSIEVSDSAIAVDGAVVTGAELRQRLGDDADAILQLSYLDPAARRAVAGVPSAPPTAPAIPPAPSPPPAPALDADSDQDRPTRRTRRREDVVRIGGSVTIDSDESVDGDVVVIGGSANIDGEVGGEVVVVGGSARLGPDADIQRDITVVGGRLSRDAGATVRGRVQEVGFGGGSWGGPAWRGRGPWDWNPIDGIFPVAKFMGTLARMGLLMLLAGLVILVARAPVEEIASRAIDEPVKSWAIGFLIEILFVPVLVLTVVVLAISIIGIPLLVLIPFAIVAAMVVFLLGFTSVAYALGGVLQERVEQLRGRPYVATFVGIIAILSPLLLARLVSLTGGLLGGLGFLVAALVFVGFVAEFVAWTTGLGAAALARFRPSPPPAPPTPPAVVTP